MLVEGVATCAVSVKMGPVVSQVKLKLDECELPAVSVAVILMTYAPSWLAEMVVLVAVGVPKVMVPGPETIDQVWLAMGEAPAVTVAVCVNCAFLVWSLPALTLGPVLSMFTV